MVRMQTLALTALCVVLAVTLAVALTEETLPVTNCVWTDFCNRLTYARQDYYERPRKSLVFYPCATNGLSTESTKTSCMIQGDNQLQLESVATIQLSRLQLALIPYGICKPAELPQLHTIDLSGNSINSIALQALSSAAFDSCKLTNVTVVNLSENPIEYLDLADLLSSFTRLEELYVDNCGLKHILIRPGFDVENSNLRLLSLTGNTLVSIDLNLLGVPSMEMIDLSKNENTNLPMAFINFRTSTTTNDSDWFAPSAAISLRRMQRTFEQRDFDYYLTVSIDKANIAGMFESLTTALATRFGQDASQTVRLVSRFISAFEYIRFEASPQAFTDCDSLCVSDDIQVWSVQSNNSSSNSFLNVNATESAGLQAKSALPTLLRFLGEHLSTLRRILSKSHFNWLMNFLSVRCASMHRVSHVSLADLMISSESSYQEQHRQRVSANQLCQGSEQDRVRQFVFALRNTLNLNSSDVMPARIRQMDVAMDVPCSCQRCNIRYDVSQRALVVKLDCAESERRNFSFREAIGENTPRLFRVISRELGSKWIVDWPPQSGAASASRLDGNAARVNTIPVYVELNLTATRIDELTAFEPGFSHVRHFTIANNRLRELDENLFRSMSSLLILDVRYNALRTLPSVVILALRELTGVRLEGNNFDCSCPLYAQLFEAQTLRVLHKLIDFHALQCTTNSTARGTMLLTDALRNLSSLLDECPAVYKVPIRVARRPTAVPTASSADGGPPMDTVSSYAAFRVFLANNAVYIITVCACLFGVLAVLCIFCVVDCIKLGKAQYVQVSLADAEKSHGASALAKTPEGGRFHQRCPSSPVTTVVITSDDLITSSTSTSSERPSSISNLGLPKQHCTINSYLTNLVNENRYNEDRAKRSGEVESIPIANHDVASSSSARANLKNVTVIHNDLHTTLPKPKPTQGFTQCDGNDDGELEDQHACGSTRSFKTVSFSADGNQADCGDGVGRERSNSDAVDRNVTLQQL